VSEIADFLRARYQERRAIAEAASPGPWHADGGTVYATHPTDEVVDYSESADHIAANDPVDVIADCDAKVALIELAERTLAFAEGDSEVDHYGALSLADETLHLLARPFDGHPDHKGEEWAP
jgi:hypothetical protein